MRFSGQNDFRMTPKLTLNLGLRYDYQGLACPQIRIRIGAGGNSVDTVSAEG